MKKVNTLLCFCALLLLSLSTSAQYKWSAGYRTGLELNDFNIISSDFGKENLVWNHELFATRKISKHFEIESSLRVGSISESGHAVVFDDPAASSYDYNQTATNLRLFLSARYNLQLCNRFGVYAQIGSSLLKSYLKSNEVAYEVGKTPRYTSTNSGSSIKPFNTISPAIGAHYNITTRIFLSLNLSANYKVSGGNYSTTPLGGYHEHPNDWSANILFGAGFRF